MRSLLATFFALAGAVVGLSQTSEPPGTTHFARRLVVTIDDLPAQRAPGLAAERLQAMTDDLLATLQRHQVPAVGFVNEDKLYADGSRVPGNVAALAQWLDAGIELGNHTYSHPFLHTGLDLETALEDPAFASPDTYVGQGGITWLHRWALTRGVERSFFQGEPTTAEWVQDLSGFQE